MKKTISRRQAREQAFILGFENIFTNETLEEMIETLKDAETASEIGTIDEFAISVVKGMIENIEDIDCLIEKNSNGWRKNRISKVSLTTIRLSVYQIIYSADLTVAKDPVGVIISEAVRLTKKYSSSDDASFVNGVLGSIARANGEDIEDRVNLSEEVGEKPLDSFY